MLPRPLVIGITILISVVWSANVIVGFIAPERTNPYVNGIFAIVAGATYALGRQQDDTPRDES